jgi:hypothetical protein
VVVWDDIATWLSAVGTCGAVVVSLRLARQDTVRRERRDRRRQAEFVTAWLGEEVNAGTELHQTVVIQNSSPQSVYLLIASLVSVQGAFRRTAVPATRAEKAGSIRWQTPVGQVPPGQYETTIRSAGHGMHLKLGVELAFRDASGVHWLRSADGVLKEVEDDPVALYNLMRPIDWRVG